MSSGQALDKLRDGEESKTDKKEKIWLASRASFILYTDSKVSHSYRSPKLPYLCLPFGTTLTRTS
jgi:hypothetical protein